MSNAYINVVNAVNPVFLNAATNDIAFYTDTSNQSLHLGTAPGTSESSTIKISKSNVSCIGNLSATEIITGNNVNATSALQTNSTTRINSTGVLTNVSVPATATGVTFPLTSTAFTGTLPVTRGGTGVTSSTGTGSVVLNTSPTISNPTFTGTVTAATITANGIQFTGIANPFRILFGVEASTASNTTFVTFESAFGASPTVTTTPQSGISTSHFAVTITNIPSTTAFGFRVYQHSDGGALSYPVAGVNVHWTAVGRAP